MSFFASAPIIISYNYKQCYTLTYSFKICLQKSNFLYESRNPHINACKKAPSPQGDAERDYTVVVPQRGKKRHAYLMISRIGIYLATMNLTLPPLSGARS